MHLVAAFTSYAWSLSSPLFSLSLSKDSLNAEVNGLSNEDSYPTKGHKKPRSCWTRRTLSMMLNAFNEFSIDDCCDDDHSSHRHAVAAQESDVLHDGSVATLRSSIVETSSKGLTFLEALRRSGKVRIIAECEEEDGKYKQHCCHHDGPAASEQTQPFIDIMSSWCTNDMLSIDNDDDIDAGVGGDLIEDRHTGAIIEGSQESRAILQSRQSDYVTTERCLFTRNADDVFTFEANPMGYSSQPADFDTLFSALLDNDDEGAIDMAAAVPSRSEEPSSSGTVNSVSDLLGPADARRRTHATGLTNSALLVSANCNGPSLRDLYQQQRQRRRAAQSELNAMRSQHGNQLVALYDQLVRQQSTASRVFRRTISSALPTTTWRVIARHVLK
jgi:hypothetical protein